jgi:pimeloyl-ACP methyl ester carboxylesterase
MWNLAVSFAEDITKKAIEILDVTLAFVFEGTVHEFIARRTASDIAAMRHRLRLIAQYDPRSIVARSACPIYLLAGVIDPIVPTWPVLRWLRKNCPTFQTHRIIWPADHNVLGTEPAKSLEQICRWKAFGGRGRGAHPP